MLGNFSGTQVYDTFIRFCLLLFVVEVILLLVVGVFAKTLRDLRLRAANPPTMNWKIAIA